MLRRLLLPAGIGLLVVFVWLALTVYRASRLGLDAAGAAPIWIAGPPAAKLDRDAAERIRIAVASLQDTGVPAEERLRDYREGLGEAERLLLRSLRAHAVHAGALTQLAAVRWELAFPQDDADRQRNSDLIALASSVAPTASTVQLQLGEVMFKMGQHSEGREYCRRAVGLNPGLSQSAVAVLRENLLDAQEIAETLPLAPETVVALEPVFFEDSVGPAFLELAERSLEDGPTPDLLAAYGHASRRLQAEQRLFGKVDRLGPFDDPALEAERLRQRSWALMAGGRVEEALADAAAARRLQPEVYYFADHLADLSLRAGDPEAAIQGYRDALRIVAAGAGNATVRARLYRKIGESEEQRGRSDRAYEAYLRSLELDPEEPRARRRVREIEAAAGFGEAPL